MSRTLQIIDDHTIIRETVGYDIIAKLDVCDLPAVMQFLRIVSNYNRLTRISKRDENTSSR